MSRLVAEEDSQFSGELLKAIPSLRAFARSLGASREEADDLVQETMLKGWAHRDRFIAGTNLKTWLFTIPRNTVFSEYRKRKRLVDDPERVDSLAIEPSQMGHLDLGDFQSALSRVPEDQREALILVGASGFSYEEVAEICGCPVGTVKSRVNRARERLTKLLGLDVVAT
jgi:RNA polymerase sigma-70 factor (ECF subfamily)